MAGKEQSHSSQCVGLRGAATWGAGPSQRALNFVLAHPHLVRADLVRSWHPEDGEQVLSWSRTLTGAPRVSLGRH